MLTLVSNKGKIGYFNCALIIRREQYCNVTSRGSNMGFNFFPEIAKKRQYEHYGYIQIT